MEWHSKFLKPFVATQRVKVPSGQDPASQPEPSVARPRSNPGREAYTGSMQAA